MSSFHDDHHITDVASRPNLVFSISVISPPGARARVCVVPDGKLIKPNPLNIQFNYYSKTLFLFRGITRELYEMGNHEFDRCYYEDDDPR